MYKERHAWYFLAIPALLLLTFSLIPAVWAMVLSFTNYNVFQPMEWVGLDNFTRAFKDAKFGQAIGNTFYYWLLATPALVVLPVFVAVLVNQQIPLINFFRLTYYFPFLVSVVVTALLWKMMFREDGIINYLLSVVGIEPMKWLTSSQFAMPSLGIITIWQGIGYYMLIYLAGLQAIPKDLYEAAEIDGAGFWRKQINITFPMLRPIIFFIAVVSTLSAFREFTLMMVMTDGGPLYATTTVVYLVYKEAFESLDMGYASALSFILFVIILIITVLNRTFFERGTQQ